MYFRDSFQLNGFKQMSTESIQKEAVDKVINNRQSSLSRLKELGFSKIDLSILSVYNENPYYFEEACKIIEKEISSGRLNKGYSNSVVMIKNWMLKFKAAEEK